MRTFMDLTEEERIRLIERFDTILIEEFQMSKESVYNFWVTLNVGITKIEIV